MKYFKNIYRFVLLLAALNVASVATLSGQNDNNVLFKAMQDEMNRSKNELILPNSPAPWFVAYTVSDLSYASVVSSKGTILYSKVNPKERLHSVNLYVGDNKFSSDYSYTGNGILTTSFTVTENNYDQLRRSFWQTSDLAYKMAVEVFNSKQNAIKSANLTEQEKSLHDMLPMVKPVIQNYKDLQNSKFFSVNLNVDTYKALANKLSSKFDKFPQIFDARVEIDAIETVYNYLSTEGTKTTEPAGYVSVTFKGKVRNQKGQVFSDEHVILSRTFETLPSEKELTASLEKFAGNLAALLSGKEIEEYYLGPVLFVEEAAAQIFAENLISPAGIFSYRKPIQVMATVSRPENVSSKRDVKPLEERINKKVIDSRISVKNITDATSFAGTPLIGYYNVDAQGIIPVKESSLIENGILKKLLSTRVPTKTSSASTGSLRYGVRPRALPLEVAPGNLIVSVKEGSNFKQLKSDLIKAAVEEGLDYAYIVKKIANQTSQYIYKVSVKDGSETMVTGAEVTPVPLTKLKRVLGLNQSQKVYNYLYQSAVPVSVVYPDGILIEDIEINRKPVNVLKNSPLISKM